MFFRNARVCRCAAIAAFGSVGGMGAAAVVEEEADAPTVIAWWNGPRSSAAFAAPLLQTCPKWRQSEREGGPMPMLQSVPVGFSLMKDFVASAASKRWCSPWSQPPQPAKGTPLPSAKRPEVEPAAGLGQNMRPQTSPPYQRGARCHETPKRATNENRCAAPLRGARSPTSFGRNSQWLDPACPLAVS